MSHSRTPTAIGATAPATSSAAPSATPPTRPRKEPLLVALPDRCGVVSTGLVALLEDQPGINLVPITTALSAPSRGVLVHDAAAPPSTYAEAAEVARSADWRRLALAWPEEQRRLLRCPASGPEPDGWLPKGADGPTLAAALRHARRQPAAPVSGPASQARGAKAFALSDREQQMLVLIAAGLSNEEIAARCYLSINSVKTFIRAAYRKIGVERRVEAAMWVSDHLDTSGAPPVRQPAAV